MSKAIYNLVKKLIPAPTVDSVISSFNKTLDRLNAVIVAQEAKKTKAVLAIQKATSDLSDASSEAVRARVVADRIAALVN